MDKKNKIRVRKVEKRNQNPPQNRFETVPKIETSKKEEKKK